MLDLSQLKYRFRIMDEKGTQYNIEDFVDDLGWEEPEKEIATRISFSTKNDSTSIGVLSSVIKLGSLVAIYASCGAAKSEEEVARGYIIDWNPRLALSSNAFLGKCYDELYNLQESQDNIYFSDGTGTKTIVTSILKSWSVPMGEYKGPDKQHAKLAYKSQALSSIILDVLDDAYKKGGSKCLLYARKGKTYVKPYGTNDEVYVLDVDNIISINHKRSTSGMVTRVKVIGQADDDGRTAVVETLNGKTKYGIRQKIVTQAKDDKQNQAHTDAQTILDENGDIVETVEVAAPDVPFVHKGDMIYCKAGTISGFYVILGVSHDIARRRMTLSLHTPYKDGDESSNSSSNKSYSVGQVVNFHGGKDWVASTSSSPARTDLGAGPAKIGYTNPGSAHPYCLITRDWAKTQVWGWVDAGSFD